MPGQTRESRVRNLAVAVLTALSVVFSLTSAVGYVRAFLHGRAQLPRGT